MQSLPPLILDLAIMLSIASIVILLFQRIKQPVVLGYLVAGIIIGPYTPPYILVNDIPNIKILSELGIIFLIFSLGLEFSFHKLVRVGFSATVTGILEVIFMTILGFWLGRWMGWSVNNALFLGAALSISSTTIIIKAIEELNLQKKHFATLIFGILIIEDLCAILMLVLLSSVVISQTLFSFHIIWIAIKLIMVIGGWFIVGYFFIPIIHRFIKPYANDESITIFSIGLCLLLVSFAAYLDYSIALGAFVMGSILAETRSIHKIRILIKPIRDIFAAVFFIATGMLMDPNIMLEQWPIILLITLVTIVGKILSSGISAFLTGQSLDTSVRVGFGMAQIGEFSFIIIGLGVTLNAVDKNLFPIVVAVSVITTFTTPYLIRSAGYVSDILNKTIPHQKKLALEGYSYKVSQILSTVSIKLSKVMVYRLLINGILIGIIFTLSFYFLFPWMNTYVEQIELSKTVSWFIAILLSSPFLWGMSFSSQVPNKSFTKEDINFSFLVSLFLATTEVIILTFLFFKTWPVILIVLFVIIVLFWLNYRKLEKTYLWFEENLKKNISRKKGKT